MRKQKHVEAIATKPEHLPAARLDMTGSIPSSVHQGFAGT